MKCNKCIKKGKLLDTTYITRGIGKTEFLVEYAAKNNCTIVVKYASSAKYIKDNFKFTDVICMFDIQRTVTRKNKDIVFDEGLTTKDIQILGNQFKVNFGYYNAFY